MRTARDVIEKLKQEAPEQGKIYFDYGRYLSIRSNTWALILPGHDVFSQTGNFWNSRFDRSKRIEESVFCTVTGKRGKFLLLARFGIGKKAIVIKSSVLKKFSFRGCRITYDPESKAVFFSDEYFQPYAIVMPIVVTFSDISFSGV